MGPRQVGGAYLTVAERPEENFSERPQADEHVVGGEGSGPVLQVSLLSSEYIR